MRTDTTYRRWLADAVDRFSATVARADRSAPVPSCPGWDVAALAAHVAGIHEWVIGILTTNRPAGETDLTAPDGDPSTLATWYRERADEMQRLMATVDPTAPCWNFSGVNTTYGFWPRRQTHEVTVHTFDALLATGTEVDIEPEVAADGIEELLTVFSPRMAARGYPADLPSAIVIAPTDVDLAWTVGPPIDPTSPVTVTDGVDQSASARLTGSASDVLLVLWKRLPPNRIGVDGDRRVVESYLGSRLAP